MKIVVSELPKNKAQCPMSTWKPFPPIVKEPGIWVCAFGAKDHSELPECTLGEEEHSCRFLIQIPPQVNW